jgi:hypothetical protein
MRLETPEIRQSIQRIVCTGCGAEANASCNCGVAYQPNAHFATSQLASDYEAGEVIPSQEKANVQIDGETILFRHDDCVLLQWQPVASSQLLEAESAKTAPLGGAA